MAEKLNAPVYILGVGCTRFGNLLETPEIKGLTLQELAAMAASEALEDAQMDPKELDAIYIGNVMVHTSHLPATYSQLSKWVGGQLTAGVHIDGACSTTNTGAALAAAGIACGAYDNVMVIGVESTLSQPKGLSPYERETIPTELTWLWTDYCMNQAYSVPQGYDIFPTYNGFVAQGYCRKYGYTIEEFDRCMFELCRTRRLHGSLNHKAINQEPLEDEAKRLGVDDPWEFWQSRYNPFIGWPSRFRSVVVPADGASAIILSSKDAAYGYQGIPVELLGFGMAVSDFPWYGSDPTYLAVDRIAFQKAYRMSGISPRDVEYLHVHDCSHIIGICTAEEAGYLPLGQGLKYAKEGRLRYDGDRPMSTHGGRHSFGHAWAASAGSDTYEAVKQMRGQAEKRQITPVPEVTVVGTHGYGLISTVLVLRR